MDAARIADLLQPFLKKSCHSEQSEESAVLSPAQLQQISTYIDLLLRWNARINLTAIRQPEEIVTRHFGESLFTARHLVRNTWEQPPSASLIDVGSGAGFPGLPIKIYAPEIQVTLIESNQKKATFLREVIRTLTLTNINVFQGRAETYPSQAKAVTLRAVEQFNDAVEIAISLASPNGRLAILIGKSQLATLKNLAPNFTWSSIPIPLSSKRVLAIGRRDS